MGKFWKALFGSFVGKLVAGIFLAACGLLGFGPDEWAEFMVSDLPQWITPAIAQVGFIVLGLLTFVFFVGSFENKRDDDKFEKIKAVPIETAAGRIYIEMKNL